MKNTVPFFLLLIVALGCSTPTKVATGPNSQQTAPSDTARRITLNAVKSFGPLELTIGEIAIGRDRVTVGVTIRNQSKEPYNFYPDQGQIVIDTLQLDANPFMGEGSLSGEIHPGVSKKGSLVYLDKQGELKPATVENIAFKFGTVIPKSLTHTLDVDWTVTLPPASSH